MKTQEARNLGAHLADLVQTGHITAANDLLAPVLAERTQFLLLEKIGEPIGAGPLEHANTFLRYVAKDRTEGGWVIIGSTLREQINRDLLGALDRCREFVVDADIWYAADILGERVPGPALLADIKPTLALLSSWRDDKNRWVRRTVGVAVHFWGKRSCGKAFLIPRAKEILAFLEPLFEERDMDALKGVGWGLKTLGKYYPDVVADWIENQLVERQQHPRALMLRKALTYLTEEQRAHATGGLYHTYARFY